jgi:hypothetical protein
MQRNRHGLQWPSSQASTLVLPCIATYFRRCFSLHTIFLCHTFCLLPLCAACLCCLRATTASPCNDRCVCLLHQAKISVLHQCDTLFTST